MSSSLLVLMLVAAAFSHCMCDGASCLNSTEASDVGGTLNLLQTGLSMLSSESEPNSPRPTAEKRVPHISQSGSSSVPSNVGQSKVALTTLDDLKSSKTMGDEESDACIPPGMRMVKTAAGFKMAVLEHDIVSQSIANTGYWEIRTPEDIARKAGETIDEVPKTGTLLDIGANIGDYTLLFASKGYNVIAVEPMSRNRAAIQASICLNPQFKDRITIVSAALVAPEEVADKRCKIKSTNEAINIGNGALTCGKSAEIDPCIPDDPNCEEVPVKTLDTVLKEIRASSIDVVKIDVENHECQVLAGGQSLMTEYHPQIMQVETMWGNTKECVHDAASRHGYRTANANENTVMVASKPQKLLSLL